MNTPLKQCYRVGVRRIDFEDARNVQFLTREGELVQVPVSSVYDRVWDETGYYFMIEQSAFDCQTIPLCDHLFLYHTYRNPA